MNQAVCDLLTSASDLPNSKYRALRALEFQHINNLNRCYEELRRIGNNINQIAHYCNLQKRFNRYNYDPSNDSKMNLIFKSFSGLMSLIIKEMKLKHDY